MELRRRRSATGELAMRQRLARYSARASKPDLLTVNDPDVFVSGVLPSLRR